MKRGRTRAVWNEDSTKNCTKCNKKLPATREYFHKKLHGLYDLREICIECVRKYDAKKYPIKREGQLARHRVYYLENRELELERNREYRKTNKEQLTKYRKEYYKNNKAQCLIWQKEWRKTKKGREIIRFHKVAHIDWRRRINKVIEKDFTLKDWKNCLKYFDDRCAYCGADEDKITMDHLIPVKKLGGTIKNNIVPACRSCNSSKNKYDFNDWYAKQEFHSENRKQRINNYITLGA